MEAKVASAELILKLYELRREPVMRQARSWFFGFNPDSTDDIMAAARGEHSAYYRMVTTYWDMACSFVNHGAIDEQMFNDANGEHVLIFAKLQPFITQLRATNPTYLAHLEKVIMRLPEAEARLEHMRKMARTFAAAADQQAQKEAASA